ncbi:hypothetical protein FACS189428_4570 [Clostridia bacterium]|nr:hypothetical protein FACS189428_4570 [Clostridia bacterium]
MENRQGPCPSGYHVPSTLEWAELFAEYAHAKGFSYVTGGNLGLMCIVESPIMYSVSAIVRCIDPINDFKLPKVAPHSEPFCDEKGDCMVMAFRKGGFYRSSSSTGKY